MRGQGLNDLPRCELERRSSHHKGIFFEVPNSLLLKRHLTPNAAHMMMWTASPQRHHSAKAWSQERHKEGDRP